MGGSAARPLPEDVAQQRAQSEEAEPRGARGGHGDSWAADGDWQAVPDAKGPSRRPAERQEPFAASPAVAELQSRLGAAEEATEAAVEAAAAAEARSRSLARELNHLRREREEPHPHRPRP